MTAARDLYAAIDLHDKAKPGWPDKVPTLTAVEAVRATRRLYRFALGETCMRTITVTSGNRYSGYGRRGAIMVNPDKGWRELLHDLSHYFVDIANDGTERGHTKFHARFETKLIREVVRRGWLTGKLRDKPKPAKEATEPDPNAARRDKLARLEDRAVKWERKAERAKRALAKLNKQRRYYERAIAKAAP